MKGCYAEDPRNTVLCTRKPGHAGLHYNKLTGQSWKGDNKSLRGDSCPVAIAMQVDNDEVSLVSCHWDRGHSGAHAGCYDDDEAFTVTWSDGQAVATWDEYGYLQCYCGHVHEEETRCVKCDERLGSMKVTRARGKSMAARSIGR